MYANKKKKREKKGNRRFKKPMEILGTIIMKKKNV